MNKLGLINNRSKFKDPGKSPIILEEIVESTSKKQRRTPKHIRKRRSTMHKHSPRTRTRWKHFDLSRPPAFAQDADFHQ